MQSINSIQDRITQVNKGKISAKALIGISYYQTELVQKDISFKNIIFWKLKEK